MTSQPHFLSLPAELLIKILLQLDNRSLIRCSLVCRDLAGLISSEVALLYQLELPRAGMVDGPPDSCRTSLSERLEKLRAYRTAWRNPTVVFNKCFQQRPPRVRDPMTGGVLPYTTGPTGLDFWKPGCRLRGVSEVRVSRSEALMEFSSVSVDLGQDLVALTTETLYPGTPHVNTYEVRLLTTAFVPHPLAAQSELRSATQRPPRGHDHWTVSATEIFGDFIAWSATTNPGQILVWNWKTGVVLLRLTPSADVSCFKFLDEAHLLVTFGKNPSLCIYEFPQPSPEDHPITVADCPCVLHLPPMHLGAMILKKKLHMQSASSDSSTAPLFHHDPDLKIVCLALDLKPRADEIHLDPDVEYYMFLFPVSALLSQFERLRASVLSPSFKPRPVHWDKWGPARSRVFKTASVDAGVSGTKVVTVQRVGWDKTDVNPLYRLSVLETNPFVVRDRDSGITTGRAFKGPIRSELPYAVTLKRDIVLRLEEGADMRRLDGSHEFLVFEDQWAFLYHEHWLYGTPNRFVSKGVYTFQI